MMPGQPAKAGDHNCRRYTMPSGHHPKGGKGGPRGGLLPLEDPQEADGKALTCLTQKLLTV